MADVAAAARTIAWIAEGAWRHVSRHQVGHEERVGDGPRRRRPRGRADRAGPIRPTDPVLVLRAARVAAAARRPPRPLDARPAGRRASTPTRGRSAGRTARSTSSSPCSARATGRSTCSRRSTSAASSCACCRSGRRCAAGRSATPTTASPSTGTSGRPPPTPPPSPTASTGPTCSCSARCSTTSARATRATTRRPGWRSSRDIGPRLGLPPDDVDDARARWSQHHLLLPDVADPPRPHRPGDDPQGRRRGRRRRDCSSCCTPSPRPTRWRPGRRRGARGRRSSSPTSSTRTRAALGGARRRRRRQRHVPRPGDAGDRWRPAGSTRATTERSTTDGTETITVVCADAPGAVRPHRRRAVAARPRRADGVGVLRRARRAGDGGVAVPGRPAAGRRRVGSRSSTTSAAPSTGELAIEARLAERARTYRRRRPMQAAAGRPAVGRRSTTTSRRRRRSSRCGRRTASACCTASPRRWPSSASTSATPPCRPSARTSSTRSTCRARNGRLRRRRRSTAPRSSGPCSTPSPDRPWLALTGERRATATRPARRRSPATSPGGARRSPPSPAPGSGSPRTCTSGSASRRCSTSPPTSRRRPTSALGSAIDAAEALEIAREQDHFVQEWLESVGVGVPGYVTPKVAIGAVVGNDDGELLLVQRADSGIWLYPTGWADVGYSPAEVAVKEVARGDRHRVRGRSACSPSSTGSGWASPASACTCCCSTARRSAASCSCHPLECADVGWFGRDDLPDDDRRRRSGGRPMAFAAIRRRGVPDRLRRRPLARSGAPLTGADVWRRGSRSRQEAARPRRRARRGRSARSTSATPRRRRRRRSRRSSSSSSSSSTSDSRRLTYSTRSSSSAISAATRASYSAAAPAKTSTGAGLPIRPARPLDEGQRRLRRRDLGGVLRHRRPQRRRRDPGRGHRVVEHADDAGRTLVARALEVEAIDQLGVAGRADDLHRPGVRHVGEQGAEADGHPRAELLGDADELGAEQLPAQRRLGTEHEQHVAAGHRRRPQRRPSATRSSGARR